MTTEKASKPSYAARVRWRSQADPRWEIETRHAGFAEAEDAALFANGFSTRAPYLMELDRGRLNLGFSDGSAQQMRSGAFQVWHLPKDFDTSRPADDSSFDRVEASPRDLSDLGLDGRWAQIAYGVLGPEGEEVDVIMQMDETGDLKVITIDERPEMADDEIASFSMARIPRA